MSAAKTGTPAVLSCSAISWRVLVLPVPVAPATRPCRLSIAERDPDAGAGERGRVEHQPAELERRTFELVARGHGLDDRAVVVRLGPRPRGGLWRRGGHAATVSREAGRPCASRKKALVGALVTIAA